MAKPTRKRAEDQSPSHPEPGAPPAVERTPPPPAAPPTVADLLPDDDNANKGTERGTGLLEQTLRNLGFGRPILIDKNRRIIAGNQVLQGAINAGLIKLRVVKTRGNEVIAHMREDVDLDSKEGRELALADNFIGRASFDPDGEVVARQVEKYEIELEPIGLSEGEMKGLLAKAKEESDDQSQGGEPAMEYRVAVVVPDEASQEAVLADLQHRYGKGKGYQVKALKRQWDG